MNCQNNLGRDTLEDMILRGRDVGTQIVDSRRLTNRNRSIIPGARFSKAPETFRARKAIAKSRTLRVQSCFIHIS